MDVSPYMDRIAKNYVPTQSEKIHINCIVTERRVIADQIGADIMKLEKTLALLRERRAFQTKHIDKHVALLSPIRQLPHHILSAIFVECLSNRREPSFHHFTMSCKYPSVVLSHVCQEWRQVALHTPLLWSYIHLTPHRYYNHVEEDADHDEPPRSFVDALSDESRELYFEILTGWVEMVNRQKSITEEWISRSADSPLTIVFDYPANDYEVLPSEVPQCLKELVELLFSVSSRWKNIDCSLGVCESTAPFLHLFDLPAAQFPALQSLKITFGGRKAYSETDKIPIPVMPGLLHSPTLRSLTIPNLWTNIFKLGANWGQLTELWLGGYSYDYLYNGTTYRSDQFTSVDAVRLLKLCPNLVRCALILSVIIAESNAEEDPTETDTTVRERVSLPYLESLEIRGTSTEITFPSCLDLPSLRRLVIPSASETRDEEESALVSWVRIHGQNLEEITFSHSSLTNRAIATVLENVPNVVKLRMSSRGYHSASTSSEATHTPGRFDNSIMERLIPRVDEESAAASGAGCLCPKLEAFTCNLGRTEFSEEMLIHFVEARRMRSGDGTLGVARIKDVSVKFVVPQKLHIIQELRERGVDMEDFRVSVLYDRATGHNTWYYGSDLD